jgi:hypothetical protein
LHGQFVGHEKTRKESENRSDYQEEGTCAKDSIKQKAESQSDKEAERHVPPDSASQGKTATAISIDPA